MKYNFLKNAYYKKILLPARWCHFSYNKTCPIVVPGKDGGQVLERGNVASTIAGFESSGL